MPKQPNRRWWLALGVALAADLPAPAHAQTSGPPFPRLANIYLHGGIDPADIPTLARWDVLVLDIAWTRPQLQQLRQLNPDIKLYFYVCAYAVQTPPPNYDPWRQENYTYAANNNLWWRNWNQTIATDWPGTQMANITALGASGPQGNWRQFFAARVERLMSDYPEIDGVFFDNFWRSIAWEQGGLIQVDSDCNPTHNPGGCNGVMDSDAQVDALWNDAMRLLATDVRQRFDALEARTPGRRLSIISNRSDDYFEYLNGTMHEYFPSGWTTPDPGNPYGYNWTAEMLSLPGGYLVAPFRSTPYRVSILNADWTGTAEAPNRSTDFERHKRFTLASTLMGDGYYSLDPAAAGHGALWWEPEFDHAGRGQGYLGYPLGPMQRIGVPTGPERVVNGGFVTALTPWLAQPTNATGTASLDATSYHSTPTSARVTITNLPNPATGYMKLTQLVPVQSGGGYTLSFWARASVAQEMLVYLYGTSCPAFRCLNNTPVQLSTAWQRFEIPFVSSGTANAGLDFFVNRLGSVWIDDVSLREGDTSVYRRDFENGIAILNYTTAPYTVNLGGSYRHLSIAGNPFYDGATVTSETLAPSDGRILLTGSGPSPAPPPPAPDARLDQNEPNPFNPSTTIRYKVATDEHVNLAVYDISGRLVRTLVNRPVTGGLDRTVIWDGKDGYGVPVRSGVYFYRIATPSFTHARKMTLLK